MKICISNTLVTSFFSTSLNTSMNHSKWRWDGHIHKKYTCNLKILDKMTKYQINIFRYVLPRFYPVWKKPACDESQKRSKRHWSKITLIFLYLKCWYGCDTTHLWPICNPNGDCNPCWDTFNQLWLICDYFEDNLWLF